MGRGAGGMRPAVLIVLVFGLGLAGCGPNAGRCGVFTKGYPLCGL